MQLMRVYEVIHIHIGVFRASVSGTHADRRVRAWPHARGGGAGGGRGHGAGAGRDLPELFRPECPGEKARARSAKAFVETFLEGREVMLHDIRRGKYAGRVAARIEADGEDLGRALVAAGLGSTDLKTRWCEGARS